MNSTIPAPPAVPAPPTTPAPRLQLSCILPAPAPAPVDDNENADTWLAPAPTRAPAAADENALTRAWRPDLVPHILAWLDSIPAESRQYLARVGVSDAGGLVALFELGHVEVSFEFDVATAMVLVARVGGDIRKIWHNDRIVPFNPRQLDMAATCGA